MLGCGASAPAGTAPPTMAAAATAAPMPQRTALMTTPRSDESAAVLWRSTGTLPNGTAEINRRPGTGHVPTVTPWTHGTNRDRRGGARVPAPRRLLVGRPDGPVAQRVGAEPVERRSVHVERAVHLERSVY